MESHKVEVYIYDLSRGMAAHFSPLVIGKRIDGIWHTSIVVYNREYFFGSRGVESCNPGSTILGAPNERKYLGDTQIPYSVFFEYLGGLSQTSFKSFQYFTDNQKFQNKIVWARYNILLCWLFGVHITFIGFLKIWQHTFEYYSNAKLFC